MRWHFFAGRLWPICRTMNQNDPTDYSLSWKDMKGVEGYDSS